MCWGLFFNKVAGPQAKNYAENKAGRLVPDLFSMTLVVIYFGRLPLGHTIKTNFIKFQTDEL